jgi:hypothetical protein
MIEKKYDVQNSAGKDLVGDFWDSEGILLVEFLKRGAEVNSERYMQTLTFRNRASYI